MKVFNFNAGPSALPKAVIKAAEKDFFNYQNSNLSVLEMSHRGGQYEEIHYGSIEKVRKLLNVPDDFSILFLQGGASLQFAMIPMNFLPNDQQAAYVLSGSWSEKAYEEATRVGSSYVLATSKEQDYRTIPTVNLDNLINNTSYIHLTSNNTIYGTQWRVYPETDSVPLVVDASSDIFSREINWAETDFLYAGAQKNAGPSGVTIVIVKKSLLEKSNDQIPKILKYMTHVKGDSLYHTPPTGSIYLLGLVMDWINEQGGVKEMEKRALEKASLLYDVMDGSNGFFKGHAETNSRSLMNVTFNLPTKELEKQFIQQAEERGFIGLKGHRSIGGLRASIYNAVPKDQVEYLASFMEKFSKTNQITFHD